VPARRPAVVAGGLRDAGADLTADPVSERLARDLVASRGIAAGVYTAKEERAAAD
jgi:hypothetical protein